jgi:hypothetical protein
LSADDAAYLSREMSFFEPADFVELPNYTIFLRLMIDGEVSRPFSAETIDERLLTA